MEKSKRAKQRTDELLRRRGLDPKNYTLIRELNYSVFFRDKRDGSVKIITKDR